MKFRLRSRIWGALAGVLGLVAPQLPVMAPIYAVSRRILMNSPG